ncbi:serine/threonine-protein kinase [Streptomyces sp. NPDC004647]|uniref:serine/threonine-protein kinase n=1 Tax=Streptomyces sp. NPDC004647 TaxID=3154671 RepID=UPI0033A22219
MTVNKDDPTVVGGYKLEHRLGAGGMGVVYLARSSAGEPVAMKVVRRQWAEDPEFRARFELEVAAARMVHSRFTAPVIDADPHASTPWMATLYVPGETLATHVAQQGSLESNRLKGLAKALAGALRDIHRAGVVHRDLKPGNVLLTDGGPLVIDFGIARAVDGNPLTATGQLVGTPAFMAPEQFVSSRKIGPSADVFSLGSVLSFAATGRSPFDSEGPYAAAYQVVHEEPDLDAVPDCLRALIARCLAKDPADRPRPEQILAELAVTSQPHTPRLAPYTRALRAGSRGWLARPVPAWVAGLTALAAITAGMATQAGPSWRSAGTHPAPVDLAPLGTVIRNPLDPGEKCIPHRDAIYCAAGNRAVLRLDPANRTIPWVHRIPASEHEKKWLHGSRERINVELLGATHVGQLFVAQRDTEYERLRILDTHSGKTLWKRKFTARPLEIRFSERTLFLVFSRRIEAIDLTTKAIRWKRDLPGLTFLISTGHGLYEADVNQPGTQVTALNEDTGKPQWTTIAEDGLSYHTSGADALYFRSQRDGALVRLDTRTRNVVRTPMIGTLAGGFPAHQAVAQGNLVCLASHDGTVVAVDSKDGRVRWGRITDVRISAPPTIVDQQIFLTAVDGSVIALDARNGRQIWRTSPRQTGKPTGPWSRPPVMSVKKRLYAFSPYGTVSPLIASPHQSPLRVGPHGVTRPPN